MCFFRFVLTFCKQSGLCLLLISVSPIPSGSMGQIDQRYDSQGSLMVTQIIYLFEYTHSNRCSAVIICVFVLCLLKVLL